ncbi:hypothetical protein VTH06DRAFT_887 [Thermothelomyces fergusii]
MAILKLLHLSDVFALSRASKGLHAFVLANEWAIANPIIKRLHPFFERFIIHAKEFERVEPAIQSLLERPDRPDLGAHRNVHQNIPPPDKTLHCACMACLMRWNALCAVIDFAHWQDHLDGGIPIPTVERGTCPRWNQELLERNRRVAVKAPNSPLRYARILDAHQGSTIRSILRSLQTKMDQHYYVTAADVRAGTDEMLQQNEPSTFDYPYARDLYYMLEAFLPGRSWIPELRRWVFMPETQEWHETDLRILVRTYEKSPLKVSDLVV